MTATKLMDIVALQKGILQGSPPKSLVLAANIT